MRTHGFSIFFLTLSFFSVHPARAEVAEVKIASQYGLSYLPLMIMEKERLFQKHANALGIGETKVTWIKYKNGGEMNKALLSGDLHFASGGVAPFVFLWAQTHGGVHVRSAGSLNSMPILLVTSNPKVKTIADFGPGDKIALPAVKTSIQAVTLQMAAEKVFGEGKHDKLDSLTVSLGHPEAKAALMEGKNGITAHFGSTPFQEQELKNPKMHAVLNSYDVLEDWASFNLVWNTSKFADDNPKVFKAFAAAFIQAFTLINKDRKQAAKTYLEIAKTNESVEEITAFLNDPKITYTINPKGVLKYASFMHRIKAIDRVPSGWSDLFFPNVRP